ncbi:hypothetical protein M2G70_07365 [Vibrio vulnificus]|nr:hypothetical protein [Vibrio vulnificus]
MNDKLLQMLITSLKSAKYSKDEIFDKVKIAQRTLEKASKYPQAFSRKVLKHPTMLTSNYGAKQCTTTESVRGTLSEIAPELLQEFLPEEFNMFCRLVFLQVGVSIPASNDYLNWSSKLLNVVAKKKAGISYNHPITGFPVNVREFKSELTPIQYKVFNKNTKTQLKVKTKEVNAQSTASTAVPCLIHSLDAGILNRTSDSFQKPMALIHDSFGAHPNNLVKLNTSINSALLEVAQGDVMQNIANQLTQGCEEEVQKASKKTNIDLFTAPQQNTFKGSLEELVMNSQYAFS